MVIGHIFTEIYTDRNDKITYALNWTTTGTR